MPRMLFGFAVWGEPGAVELVCLVRNLYLVRAARQKWRRQRFKKLLGEMTW